MIDARYKTVHRFIPAIGLKHGDKTACGIELYLHATPEKAEWVALDGMVISLTEKGKPFDCKRCRVVLERHHADRMTV